mgnify:CR=1 FL=1
MTVNSTNQFRAEIRVLKQHQLLVSAALFDVSQRKVGKPALWLGVELDEMAHRSQKKRVYDLFLPF